MTERLYYTDPSIQAFEARVVSCDMREGGSHVVLDRTAFYPTSGGQPFDTGRLGGAEVLDVMDRDDGEVVHVTSRPLEVGATVAGEIRWVRRVDHMQQHTGQHILSAAFDRVFNVTTVSFHMSTEGSSIDLSREVTWEEANAAEAEANRVVWDDRPVTIRFAPAEEAERLGLRKATSRTGELRLIEIADFDLSACGGTHVSRTGSVGIVALTGMERVRGGSRVWFACGVRVMHSHRTFRGIIGALTRSISVLPADLPASVERLQQGAKAADKTVRALQRELAGFRADAMARSAETIGGRAVVLRPEPELDGAALKELAAAVVERPGLVAVLVGHGSPAPVVIARSADIGLDAAALLATLVGELGGRGGGTPDFAQGGLRATPAGVVDAVRRHLS